MGSLVKDGYNISSSSISQRYICNACGKRFGNDVNEWNLNIYEEKIKQIAYELFIEGSKQVNMAKRWKIPQSKLSKFKKTLVNAIFEQKPDLLNTQKNNLPKGVIYADETYLGKRGNSNTEILFTNHDFNVLSTGIGEEQHLEESIIKTFFKIPEDTREKLRVLVTDGEHSYRTLTSLVSHKVVLVQQYHGHKKLGLITLHKYQQFGPHLLHYLIHTHWQAFNDVKTELKFKWEIKLIPGKLSNRRGRPGKQMLQSPLYQKWKQKKLEYESPDFQKSGTAKVLVNLDSQKISLRQGSKKWMKTMFQPVLKIFSGKYVTNNKSESKNSQIKRAGNMRKQPDEVYSDQLYQLHEYIVRNGHLPDVFLSGRPLYKYLVVSPKERVPGYRTRENNRVYLQNIIDNYL